VLQLSGVQNHQQISTDQVAVCFADQMVHSFTIENASEVDPDGAALNRDAGPGIGPDQCGGLR